MELEEFLEKSLQVTRNEETKKRGNGEKKETRKQTLLTL
jgi:hypothetical protein